MVYLRTYGGGFRQNEHKTLVQPVDLGALLDRVSQPAVKITVAKYTYHPPVHLWDFGARASTHLTIGDIVYVHCEDTLYYSCVFDRVQDPQGEIGDLVEWHRIQQHPWQNPVVLKPLIQLEGLAPVVHLLSSKVQIEDNFFRLTHVAA